jgi:hypothetical protein
VTAPFQPGEHVTLRDPRWHCPQALIVADLARERTTNAWLVRCTWPNGTGSITRPATALTRGWTA